MKDLLIRNRYFLIPYIIFLAVFAGLSLVYTKAQMHIWANSMNAPVLDTFFMYATHLGDGAMIAVLTVILLFVKYRYALAFLTGSLLTSGVVHLFKKVLLHDMYRPSKYFELYETHQLYLIEGINLHSIQSFPSGHTSTAFNVFLMLALIADNKWVKFLCFMFAFLTAYSRVYLSQHFFIDLAAGSFIAVTLILVFYYWSLNWNRKWLDKSVLKKEITLS